MRLPLGCPSTRTGALALALSTWARAAGSELAVGQPVSQALSGGERHEYQLDLVRGTYLRLTAEQRGIDVVLTLVGPQGPVQRAQDVEAPTDAEELVLLVPGSGRHHIEIAAAQAAAAPGEYRLLIEELREGRPDDPERVAAAAEYRSAQAQAAQPDAQARRAALERFSALIPIWNRLGDPRREAESLNERAVLQHALGNLPAAREDLRRSLALHREIGRPRGQAEAHSNLGVVLGRLGDKPGAIEHLEQALPLWRELGDVVGEAKALNNLGTLHKDLGDLQRALDYYARSLPLRRRSGDVLGEATVLTNMGVAYRTAGQTERALEVYRQAAALARVHGDRLGEAHTLWSLAAVHVSTGEPERALEPLRQALEVASLAGQDAMQGGVLNSLGSALRHAGRNEEALAPLERSLALARTRGDRQAQATTLVHLAGATRALGRREQAEAHATAALQVSREVGDRVAEAWALVELGLLREGQGRLPEARDHYLASLERAQGTGDVLAEANSRYRLAAVAAAQNDLDAARSGIASALVVYESLRARLASQRARSAQLASVHEAYELEIEILMRLHQAEPGAGHDRRAFEAAERQRARSFLDWLAGGGQSQRSLAPGLLEQQRLLRGRLNAAAERQSAALRRGASAEQARALAREVDVLVSEAQDLDERIQASPAGQDLQRGRPATAAEIQGLLDEETLLVAFSLGREQSFAWVIGPASLQGVRLPPRSEIDRAAREAQAALTETGAAAPGTPALVAQQARFERAAQSVSELILAPLAGLLTRPRLAIVPDGALHYLPFAALPLPGGPHPEASPAVLVDRHELTLLPSGSVLVALRRAQRPPAGPSAVAVIADPVFEAEDPRLRSARSVSGPSRLPAGDATGAAEGAAQSAFRAIGRASARIPRLPFSRREARAIAALAPSGGVRLALDFEASRETALSPDLARHRVVHFATHGVLNDQHPELSGIVLSLFDTSGRPQDGFVRVHDVAQLDLPVELVVLSACQTGLGQEVRGEGLLGLTRGFMQAGARHVLASLSRVEDRATTALMQRFYAALLKRGSSPAAALREAQRSLKAHPRWRAPLYWAAFTVHGDWK